MRGFQIWVKPSVCVLGSGVLCCELCGVGQCGRMGLRIVVGAMCQPGQQAEEQDLDNLEVGRLRENKMRGRVFSARVIFLGGGDGDKEGKWVCWVVRITVFQIFMF